MAIFGAVCKSARCRVVGRHAHLGDVVQVLAESEAGRTLVYWKAPAPMRRLEALHVDVDLDGLEDDLEWAG